MTTDTTDKIYRMFGVDVAMELLRPDASWEFNGSSFTRWDDPRPCPTVEEVNATMEKLKAFEDSIDTIWLPRQIEEINKLRNLV